MKLSLAPPPPRPGITAPVSARAARLQALQRQIQGARSHPKARGHLPAQQPPIALTHAYLAALLVPVRDARRQIEQHLVAQAKQLAGDASRGHVVHDQVTRAVDQARSAWAREWPAHRLAQLAAGYGQRTSEFQREQLERQLHAGLGFTPSLPDRAAPRLVQAWTGAGAIKIAGVVTTYFQQVQARALSALKPAHGDSGGYLTSGADNQHLDAPPPPPPDGSFGSIPEPDGSTFELRGKGGVGDFILDLGTRGDVAESRAGQVADLDVRSLFADLNQDRQKELGLDAYRWRTMEDDRVRPEHAALDGRVFPWDAPPAIGNPGEPANCRCQAEPDLSGLAQ